MTDPPTPDGIDPDEIPTRSDDGTAADLAGQFVAEAATQGCLHGCGCLVVIVLGLVLSVGSAVAAMTVR